LRGRRKNQQTNTAGIDNDAADTASKTPSASNAATRPKQLAAPIKSGQRQIAAKLCRVRAAE
jgi:hypothetical protein